MIVVLQEGFLTAGVAQLVLLVSWGPTGVNNGPLSPLVPQLLVVLETRARTSNVAPTVMALALLVP